MKLRGKVSIAIIVPLAILLALAIRADLVETRSRIIQEGSNRMRRSARNVATVIDGQCRRMAQVAETASISVSDVKDWTRDELFGLAHGIVAQDPILFGFGIAWEASPGPERKGIFFGYAERSLGGIEEIDLTARYDIAKLPRYVQLKDSAERFWDQIQIDKNGVRTRMIAYLAPVMSGGRFIGGVFVDVEVDAFGLMIERRDLDCEDWAIVDENGQVVASSPGAGSEFEDGSVGDFVVRERQDDGPDRAVRFEDLIARAAVGESFVEEIATSAVDDDVRMVAFAPIEEPGWVLVSGRSREVMTRNADRLVLARAGAVIAIALTAIGIVLFGTWWVVLRPVRRIAEVVSRAAEGDRSARVGLGGQDELAMLGSALDEAFPRLDELARTQASLDSARVVQESLLPAEPLNDAGVSMAGRVIPSDQTGGDYFDYGELGDGRIAIGLGDATGHGMPSALFVATARAYVRASIMTESDLASAIELANHRLCLESSAGLFMVLFAAILDRPNGSLEVASAGHPGFLLRSGEDRFEEIKAGGIPLGIQPSGYRSTTLEVASGDVLLVASDGAWECRNPEGEILGLDRLLETAVAGRDRSAESQVADLFDFVHRFADGQPLDDDCTILVVRVD
ncbi:MAG: hypothetical protein CMJ27_10995 [Phycisphaerae bacterium]|nr:hypothetical protein [Phycisphaerae bacterium]